MIPDASEWVIHVSPAAIVESGSWSLVSGELGHSADYVEAVGLFANCELGLDDLEHVRIGFAGDEFAVVVSGAGLGTRELGQCLIRELQAMTDHRGAVELIAWAQDPKVSTVELPDGRVYLLGADVLAYVSPG